MSTGGGIALFIFSFVLIVMILSWIQIEEPSNNTKRPHQNKNNESDMNTNENDLSDFRITVSVSTSNRYSSFNENKTKNRTPGRWLKKGESIKFRNQQIDAGMVYVGGKLQTQQYYAHEPSLLDETLKIYSYSGSSNENDDPYYLVSYLNLAAKHRAIYIKWLASDRTDLTLNINYILLYFCGLERRLVVDSEKELVSIDEYKAISKELLRLKALYGANSSFERKVDRLLTYSWVIFCSESNQEPPDNLLNWQYEFNIIAAFKLGKVIASGLAIDSELAMLWINNDPEVYLRTPAQRCKNEFLELFKIKYKEKYPDGLTVKPNKTRLTITYRPVNDSIEWIEKKYDLPDVSMLSAPVKKIMKVVETCTVSLDPYSRYLGRNTDTKEPLAAIVLLPNELTKNINNSAFTKIKNWLDDQYSANNLILSVNDLLLQFGDEAPININKKESIFIAKVLEKAGYGCAPDVWYHLAKPQRDGKIVIYKSNFDQTISLSKEFNIIGTILRLGSMVAVIDNQIHELEVEYLKSIINTSDYLSENEKQSLHAYLIWRLNTPINMAGLKSRIEIIDDREKSAISNILVNVALADGEIKPSEINQLQKLYNSLGLDKNLVLSDIHKLSSGHKHLPISNSRFGNDQNHRDIKSTSFSLNESLIKSHEEDTKKVKTVLESIFVDENVIEEENLINKQLESSPVFSKLDDKHLRLFKHLLSKEEWQKSEIEKKCDDLNIMLDGSLELINDWSYDCVDAPLIEDGEILFIDFNVAEEIKALY